MRLSVRFEGSRSRRLDRLVNDEIGNAPVERVGRDAADAGVAGDVHDVRIPIHGLRRVLRQRERHRVHGAAVIDVQRDGQREARAVRVTAERREDVDALVVAAPVLHLRVEHHDRALLAAPASSPRSTSSAETAAPAAAAPGRRRREVVGDPAAEVVADRIGRRRVMEVLRRSRKVWRRNVMEQRERCRARALPAGSDCRGSAARCADRSAGPTRGRSCRHASPRVGTVAYWSKSSSPRLPV